MLKTKNIADEISAGVNISVFLGTATLFFVGILIAKLGDLNSQIRIGILFLIVATFAFIFSAIVYANLSGAQESSRDERGKYLTAGNALSEFLGLYVFMVAIPLVVTSLTTDNFMRLSALIVTLISLVGYTVSPFSMASRVLSKGSKIVYSLILITLIVSLTIGQIHTEVIFVPLAIGALTFFGASAIAFFKLSRSQ